MTRFLITHPRYGVVATAGDRGAAITARNVISDEMFSGEPSARDGFLIIGPLPGDPDDPDVTIRKESD